MIPILIAPPLLLTVLLLLPFLEAWITGDKREHHLLQRPRNAPTRTAFMVSLMTFYACAWAAGGNDIIAIKLHLSINQITYFLRGAIFIAPLIAFIITRRWCISLQRHDREKLLHGYETGIIMRSPEGGYSERHLPISDTRAYALTARDRDQVYSPEADDDDNGIPAPNGRLRSIRARLSTLMFADNVQKPSTEELEERFFESYRLTCEKNGKVLEQGKRVKFADLIRTEFASKAK
jgi:ubiquinol-cytochrome c reductase cytochrome b subunit